MAVMNITERIEAILREHLAPLTVEIEDESHLHAGHAGAGSGGHFDVLVVSSLFAGLPLVKRHRLVYEALSTEMKGAIHALALRTLTPEEWHRP